MQKPKEVFICIYFCAITCLRPSRGHRLPISQQITDLIGCSTVQLLAHPTITNVLHNGKAIKSNG